MLKLGQVTASLLWVFVQVLVIRFGAAFAGKRVDFRLHKLLAQSSPVLQDFLKVFIEYCSKFEFKTPKAYHSGTLLGSSQFFETLLLNGRRTI